MVAWAGVILLSCLVALPFTLASWFCNEKICRQIGGSCVTTVNTESYCSICPPNDGGSAKEDCAGTIWKEASTTTMDNTGYQTTSTIANSSLSSTTTTNKMPPSDNMRSSKNPTMSDPSSTATTPAGTKTADPMLAASRPSAAGAINPGQTAQTDSATTTTANSKNGAKTTPTSTTTTTTTTTTTPKTADQTPTPSTTKGQAAQTDSTTTTHTNQTEEAKTTSTSTTATALAAKTTPQAAKGKYTSQFKSTLKVKKLRVQLPRKTTAGSRRRRGAPSSIQDLFLTPDNWDTETKDADTMAAALATMASTLVSAHSGSGTTSIVKLQLGTSNGNIVANYTAAINSNTQMTQASIQEQTANALKNDVTLTNTFGSDSMLDISDFMFTDTSNLEVPKLAANTVAVTLPLVIALPALIATLLFVY